MKSRPIWNKGWTGFIAAVPYQELSIPSEARDLGVCLRSDTRGAGGMTSVLCPLHLMRRLAPQVTLR
jgi:hypothetical protein